MVGQDGNNSRLITSAHVGREAKLQLLLVARDLIISALSFHLSVYFQHLRSSLMLGRYKDSTLYVLPEPALYQWLQQDDQRL